MENGGDYILFPSIDIIRTYHLMYQLEESIHFAINRHLSSPVSKTVLNDDVISFTAGMQTLWTESNLPSIYKHADHCCGEFKIDDIYQPSNWNWRIFLSSPARHRAKLWRSTTFTAADPSIVPSPPWRRTSPTRSTPLPLPDYPTQEGERPARSAHMDIASTSPPGGVFGR